MSRNSAWNILAPDAARRRFRGFFLGCLALLPAFAAAEGAWGRWVPAQDDRLRWEGRVRFDEAKAAHYDWTAVRVHADFEGSTLAVYARLGENHLDVLVDGLRVAVLGPKASVDDTAWAAQAVEAKVTGGVPVYVVQGLAPGRHRLTLSKRTGANFGVATLLGLRFDAAAVLHPAPAAQSRRLEFIGDSLTNAYGAEGPGLQCKTLAPYENSSLSWARLSADALGAEAQLLAFSGFGLMRNYGAAGSSSPDPVPFYYPRSLAKEEAAWDRSAFVPELSIIFLGTNDHSTQPHPKTSDFAEAYAAFLDQVREGRPQLKVLLVYPDDQSALAQRVKSVIEAQQMVGHWVEGLGLPNALESELGCDWHPKAVVHARWSELAVAKIRKIMEW